MTGSYGGGMAITIGLAGAGRRASEAYAPALAATQDATFGGVWAPVLPTAQRLAGQYGVRTYQRFADLLDECDAVAFAVPPAAQPGLAELAAGRSRAVLLEMPLAADLAGAEQVARAVAGRSCRRSPWCGGMTRRCAGSWAPMSGARIRSAAAPGW